MDESQDDKFNRGLDLFMESVHKPDHELRQCAHNQKCYHELMYIRSYVLDYLIETPTYLAKMKEVESVVDKLHLTDLYR